MIYLSSMSVKQLAASDADSPSSPAKTSKNDDETVGTPTRSKSKMNSPLGTVQTPAGRRSARLKTKTRKED